MSDITVGMIRELRERTGAGMMDCKRALEETGGDMEKAIDSLRKKGLASAAKKAGRAAHEGIIASYIHHNHKVGVIAEVRCESDFVARTDQFKTLASDIAMHIAWANPQYVDKTDIPEEEIAREKEIEKERARQEGRPEAVLDKIVEGRIAKYYERVCLLEQPFVKDDGMKVRDVIAGVIAVLGENIVVGKFSRLSISD